jgi:hypothetical protein
MDDYVSKPIDPKVLFEVMSRWVGSREETPESMINNQSSVKSTGVDSGAGRENNANI